MKRRFVGIVTVLILMMTISVPSFADTENNDNDVINVPEAVALVEIENVDCKLINEIGDLCVKISFASSGETIAEIPVVRVEETDEDMLALWLGYEPKQKILDSVKQQMENFQKDFHLDSWASLKGEWEIYGDDDEFEDRLSEMESELNKIFSNYTVELTGLPEKDGHEFKTEAGAMILTSELTNEFLQMFKELVGEALKLTKEELAQIDSFSSMLDIIEVKLIDMDLLDEGKDILSLVEELSETKFTEEEKTQFYDEIAQLDEILAYMKSEEYTGTVIAGVYVTCGCPIKIDYLIVHQYFKKSGDKVKLVGTETYGPAAEGLYLGFTGDTVKAADYINCEYKGETYKYIGSYDSVLEFYDQSEVDEFYNDEKYWAEYAMDEFVINDEFDPDGLVLRYELNEKTASEAAVNNNGDSPQTGDDTMLLPYFIIMILSALGMVITVASRRKNVR